jgi:drug/metabolite transporter (DMT)-like permease
MPSYHFAMPSTPRALDRAGGGVRPASPYTPLVIACLAATWLVWGSTYLAIKFALPSFPPFFQMGSRFVLAGALLFAWMRGVRGAPLPSARQWAHASGVGALMLGGGMGLTAHAEVSVSSGLVVAFIAVVPVMIAALNRVFGVRTTRLEAVGIATGLGGVLLLAQGDGFAASPGGLAAMAAATLCWSLGSVLSQRRWPLAPGAMGFASEMLAGGVVLLAVSLALGERPQWPPQASAVGAWVFLVVFGSLVAFNAYMVLLARAPAAVASSYTLVTPLIGMLLGMAVLGERVAALEWAGLAVVLAGVVVVLAAARRSAAPP